MAWCTYRTEDLVEAPAGKRREKTHPIAVHRFNTAVACMRRGRVGKLVVSLTEGKVNRLDLDLKTGIIIRVGLTHTIPKNSVAGLIRPHCSHSFELCASLTWPISEKVYPHFPDKTTV